MFFSTNYGSKQSKPASRIRLHIISVCCIFRAGMVIVEHSHTHSDRPLSWIYSDTQPRSIKKFHAPNFSSINTPAQKYRQRTTLREVQNGGGKRPEKGPIARKRGGGGARGKRHEKKPTRSSTPYAQRGDRTHNSILSAY